MVKDNSLSLVNQVVAETCDLLSGTIKKINTALVSKYKTLLIKFFLYQNILFLRIILVIKWKHDQGTSKLLMYCLTTLR